MKITPHKSIVALVLTSLIIAILHFAAAELVAAQRKTVKHELKAGERFGGEIGPGELDIYALNTGPGDYFQLLAAQQNLNISVALIAPDGKRLTEVNDHRFRNGIERLYWIADHSGTYQIEIRSLETEVRGSYEIRLEAMRKAAVSDELQVRALTVYREGRSLANQSDNDSRSKAIEMYEQALKLFQQAGDGWGQAASLHRIGRVYWELKQWPQTIDYLSKAVSLYHAAGDLQGEATALNDQAGALMDGNNEVNADIAKSTKLLETALPIAQASGDNEVVGRILYNHASIYDRSTGDSRKAIHYYQASIPPRLAAGDMKGVAASSNNMGMAYFDIGEPHEALKAFDQALTAIRVVGDRGNEVGYISNTAMGLYFMGETQRALETLQQAFAIIDRDKLSHMEPYALHLRAQILNSLGEPERALEAYERNLKNIRQLKNRPFERATLMSIGEIHQNIGQYEKAIATLTEALDLKVDPRVPDPQILVRIAGAYLSLGNITKSLETLEQAMPLFTENDSPWERASAFDTLGRAHLKRNQPQKAVDAFIEASKVSGSKEKPIQNLDLAKAYRALGDLANARAISEAIIAKVESQRASLLNPDFRASYFARHQDAYNFQIDLLMDLHRQNPNQGFDAFALEVSEMRRARTLLEGHAAARIDLHRGVDQRLLEQENILNQRLNAKEQFRVRLLSGPRRGDQVAIVNKEIQTLLEQYQQTQDQIRKASPANVALTRPQKLSLKEIQSLLDADTLLLEYSLGPEHSFVWAVTNNSLEAFKLPSRDEIESATSTLFTLFTARQPRRGESQSEYFSRVAKADAEYKGEISRLSRLLLSPFAKEIKKRRILIVPDSSLAYLPFGALVNPNSQAPMTTLVVDHEIAYLPSVATLAVLRREAGRYARAQKSVAVFADPVFGPNDDRIQKRVSITPKNTSLTNDVTEQALRSAGLIDESEPLQRLPFSRHEADAITSFTTGGEALKALGFRASLATVTSGILADYRIIHFATHAWINSSHPYFSGLVLSLVDEQGRPQDGFLSLNQIYNLNLSADLVVLSACQTATGKEIKGEGPIGLSRAFMYAGAPRVVASLWKVDDAATSEIVKKFYQGMLLKRLPPVAALRAAQIDMSKSKLWSSPFYWAGFVLQGEPN